MKKMTIMIVAYNQAKQVELCLDSIRMFADVDEISVIVADNGSTDELRDWASKQEDITYVYMDEGRSSFAYVFNQVREALQLTEDILVMGGAFLLTPFLLSRMQRVLHSAKDIGAVGPLSNTFSNYQKADGAGSLEETIDWLTAQDEDKYKQVLGLDEGAVLLKAEALAAVGKMDENLFDARYVFRDYFLRMISEDWKLMVCENAILWNLQSPYEDCQSTFAKEYLEQKWGMHYFNAMYNENLVDMIQEEEKAEVYVLEVGCDCGATLLEIHNRYPNAHVYGCELNAQAVKVAAHVAEASQSNIEEKNLPYAHISFDYVIFGDVLEHLRDPLETVRYCRSLLKEKGHIIASIPNLMHISVLQGLLQGDFTYTEFGLLDKTHIHFFTYNEIVRMFQQAGFAVEQVGSVVLPLGADQERLITRLMELGGNAERFMFETFQYVVRAEKQFL